MRVTIGALCWLAAVLIAQPVWWPTAIVAAPIWPTALLLLAALVLVPLALDLVDGNRTLAARVQLPAALLLVLACVLEQGPLAAWLSVPWLIVTLLIALSGLRRLPRAESLGNISIACGLIYIAVGGAWTVLSRLGARPLDFSDAIVGATAVHFHYAGFVLPILTGLSARIAPGPSARIACIGVIAGVPLVAAGITLSVFTSTAFEAVAAWLLVASCWLVAVRQLHVARQASVAAAFCLALSAMALVVGMGCAALYAWGRLTGSELLSIPLMYRVHGAVNALGFALPGLIGWTLLAASTVRADGVSPETD